MVKSQSLFWCITVYDDQEFTDLFNDERITYIVGQREKCPETGRLHYQIYAEFRSRIRFTTLKKSYPTSHFESRLGTQDEAIEYCIKQESSIEGSKFERGEKRKSQQGKRSDLEQMKQYIDEGHNLKEISNTYFSNFLRYNKGINLYMNMNNDRCINTNKQVIWIYGSPGSGKTRYVYDSEDIDDIYSCFSLKWFCGYSNHKVLLIDDFDTSYDGFELRRFLKLLDIYPITMETKGSSVKVNPERIYITSNRNPDDIFLSNSPVIRRITRIIKMGDQ